MKWSILSMDSATVDSADMLTKSSNFGPCCKWGIRNKREVGSGGWDFAGALCGVCCARAGNTHPATAIKTNVSAKVWRGFLIRLSGMNPHTRRNWPVKVRKYLG